MIVNDLKMKLIQLNESIDMIQVQLSKVDDPQLEERMQKLLEERREIITKLEGIN